MGAKKMLTYDHEKLICEWIADQSRKVTWPAIAEACPGITGKEFSLPTLRTDAIVEKRAEKNDRVALGEIADPDELPSKRNREKTLRVRASVLSMENDNLLGQIVRWTYNANRMGYSTEELDRQLPPAKRPTREQHERRMREIDGRTRLKVQKQLENERNMDAKRAQQRAKKAAKADVETEGART